MILQTYSVDNVTMPQTPAILKTPKLIIIFNEIFNHHSIPYLPKQKNTSRSSRTPPEKKLNTRAALRAHRTKKSSLSLPFAASIISGARHVYRPPASPRARGAFLTYACLLSARPRRFPARIFSCCCCCSSSAAGARMPTRRTWAARARHAPAPALASGS